MARKYMDETILKFRQQTEEVKAMEEAEEIIAQEIAIQNISDGYAVIDGETVSFAPRKLLQEKIQIILPTNWGDLPLEMAKLKYPYEARPPIILSDPTMALNFTVNHTITPLKKDAINIASLVSDMKMMTDKCLKARFFEDGLVENEDNGIVVGWYDFSVSGLGNEDLYNFVFATSLDNRALILSLNCPDQRRARWKSIAQDILLTLEIASRDIESINPNEEEKT